MHLFLFEGYMRKFFVVPATSQEEARTLFQKYLDEHPNGYHPGYSEVSDYRLHILGQPSPGVFTLVF